MLERHQARTSDPQESVRLRQWARKSSQQTRERLVVAGREASPKRSIADPFTPPNLEWICRFTIPFAAGASKNQIYNRSRTQVYKRKGGRDFQNRVESAARAAIEAMGVKPVPGKVWISIFVEKPNNKFDAINSLDSIADALKRAIGIDDKWFSVRQIDWSVCKTGDANIIVEFGQESAVPHHACSTCGNILPITEFSPQKRANGVGSTCKPCRAAAARRKPRLTPAEISEAA